MTRLALAFLLLAAPAWGGGYTLESSGDYSDILMWVSFESGDNTGVYDCDEHDLCPDPTGTRSGASVLSGGLGSDTGGTNGFDLDSNAGSSPWNILFAVTSEDIFDSTSGRFGCWIDHESQVSGTPRAWVIQDNGGSSNVSVSILGGTNNDFSLRWDDGSVPESADCSAGDTFGAGVISFAEFRYDASADQLESFQDGTSCATNTNAIDPLTGIDEFYIGNPNSSDSGALAWDVCITSNDPDRDLWELVDPNGEYNWDSYDEIKW